MVSMKDIASACGVSVATVSKALSDHRDIKEETKERIRAKADEMGYLPNMSARFLKTNRSFNIGVLFEDAAGSGLTHDFFAAVLQSFKNAVEQQGYDVTFLNTTAGTMSYVDRARYRGFDGLAIACLDFNDPMVQELLTSDLKVVTVDYVANNRSAVMSDNEDGMKELMRYVISRGHRRIAYIYGDSGIVTRYRLAAYFRSMEEAGLSVPPEYSRESTYRNIPDSYRITEELLNLKNPPTCILYPDDIACFGGINAIKSRGLRIPEDISVVGFDGIRAAQYEDPPLTTFAQDTDAIGRLAAVSLLDEIEHPRTSIPGIQRVSGHLVEGGTVKNIALS